MAPAVQGNHPKKEQHGKVGRDRRSKRTSQTEGDRKATSSDTIPSELQQLLLDIFQSVFSSRFNDSLQSLVQEVKQHLYNRDFAAAFGKEAFLEAYAIRWSPSRALAYADLLYTSPKILAALTSRPVREDSKSPSSSIEVLPQTTSAGLDHEPEPVAADEAVQNVKVVCLGGGAGAELFAFAGFLRCASISKYNHHAAEESGSRAAAASFDITAVDVADWDTVLETLYTGLTAAPAVSKYSFSGGLATKGALIDSKLLKVNFQQQDVLKMEVSQLGPLLKDCHLVTLMFTLNELYSTSMSATTNLLLSMTYLLEPGSLLLVVDSPGSYSTVSVGKASMIEGAVAQKKYPMQWLLDHTLLEAAAIGSRKRSGGDKQWEKVDECESRWFRIPEGLKYPIDLEDMRYQLHFYRRL